MRACKVCGKSFYAARWQMADIARNTAVYCSRACKYQAARLEGLAMSTSTRMGT